MVVLNIVDCIEECFDCIEEGYDCIEQGCGQLLPSFPVYHTPLDTFEHLQESVDPGFKATNLVLKFTAELLLQLSSLTKLPFDVREMADFLEEEFDSLRASLNTAKSSHLDSLGILLTVLSLHNLVTFTICHRGSLVAVKYFI